MADPAKVEWPGLTDFDSCTYTCTHGSSPGIATLICSESQAPLIKESGDLIFNDGVNPPLVLPQCKIVSVQAINQGGRKLSIQIADGRWRWAFGGINGRYNVRDDDGKFIAETHKPFPDLCDLLLDELGATERLIIPTGPANFVDFPFIDWDRANPAAALEELASNYNGAVCYQPFKNRILIAELGKGEPLPTNDYIDGSVSFDFPQTPKHIRVLGAEVVAIVALALEAVGIEPGGEIVPIDDLSYKPANGWGRSVPPYFDNLTVPANRNPLLNWLPGMQGVNVGVLTRAEYNELAKRCVYRWYRIRLLGPDGKKLTVIDPIRFDPFEPKGDVPLVDLTNINQILPQSQVYRIGEIQPGGTIQEHFAPPRVYGVAHRGAINQWANTNPDDMHDVGFTIDSEKGLVMFDRYMYRLAPTASAVSSLIGGGLLNDQVSSFQVGPAELVLVTSCFFRERPWGQVIRYHFDHATGSKLDSPPLIRRRPQIREIIEQDYDPTTWKVLQRRTNKDDCDKESKFYATKETEAFAAVSGGQRSYTGILPIDPDGYIREVTWSVGGGRAPTTTISYNAETSPWIPTYAERKKAKKLKAFVDYMAMPIANNSANKETKEAAMKGAQNNS